MADNVINVNFDPGTIDRIKLALSKEISEAVEQAYREGWADANTEGMSDIDADWEASEVKKKVDSFGKL
jgi:hypothetical protein